MVKHSVTKLKPVNLRDSLGGQRRSSSVISTREEKRGRKGRVPLFLLDDVSSLHAEDAHV